MSLYKASIKKIFDLQKFGMKFGLESMNNLLSKLGDPHKGGKFIHLAGTNGKGSVATCLNSILTEAGYKVGVYTSPHLITFRERIKINHQYISEEEVVGLIDEVWAACDEKELPTFFEFVTALAFLYFKRQNVDIAVIETGLGGRLDSTNVIDPLITALTNVYLDHTEQLGPTISHIAKEKSGIIKKNRLFVGGYIVDEVLRIIEMPINKFEVPSYFAGRDFTVQLIGCDNNRHSIFNYQGKYWAFENLICGLCGRHQIENSAVALAILENLSPHGFTISEDNVRQGLLTAVWPGRMETFNPGTWPQGDFKAQMPLILDGAHNPAGVRSLAATLTHRTWNKLHMVLGIMADKDIIGVLGPLLKFADYLYLTKPNFHRAAKPKDLLQKLENAFGPLAIPVYTYETIPETIMEVAQKANIGDLVLVAGSLFTVGETRAFLLGIPEVESN